LRIPAIRPESLLVAQIPGLHELGVDEDVGDYFAPGGFKKCYTLNAEGEKVVGFDVSQAKQAFAGIPEDRE
jgi:hypothetical protein